MANKFRGTTWNNARFGPKIQIRRSIDLAELGDFGEITENSSDLPTAGATHRSGTKGSTSATRGYTDLQGLFDTVVDNQDMGLVADATTAHRIWSSTGAISDIVTSAPTGILPGSGSTSSVASWTRTWSMTSDFASYVAEDQSERQSLNITGTAAQGAVAPWILAYPLQWSDDGYQLYIQGEAQKWIQHGVSTAWDPTSIIDVDAATTSTSGATDAQGIDRLLFRVVDGGDKVLSWRGAGTTQKVYMDTLSTSGDLTSKVNTTTNIWSAQDMIDIDGSGWKIDHMSPDGTKLYVITYGGSSSVNATTQKWTVAGGNGTTIIEFTLSTAWDLTTISVTNSQSYSFYSYARSGYRSMNFTPDGLQVYTTAKSASYAVELQEHNLTTAWDISTASVNSNTLNLFGDNIDPRSATFAGDGKKMHFFDNYMVKTIDLEAEKDSGA